MFRKTGEIGLPMAMLAYRLKISLVAKSIIAINFILPRKLIPGFDAVSFRYVLIYLTYEPLSKIAALIFTLSVATCVIVLY